MGKPITTIAEWQEKYAAHKSADNMLISDEHVIAGVLNERYIATSTPIYSDDWLRVAKMVTVAKTDKGEAVWFIDEQCIGVYNPNTSEFQMGDLRSLTIIKFYLCKDILWRNPDDGFIIALSNAKQYNAEYHDPLLRSAVGINPHVIDGRVYLFYIFDLHNLPGEVAYSYSQGYLMSPTRVSKVGENGSYTNFTVVQLGYSTRTMEFSLDDDREQFHMGMVDITDIGLDEINKLLVFSIRLSGVFKPDRFESPSERRGLTTTDKPYFLYDEDGYTIYVNQDILHEIYVD